MSLTKSTAISLRHLTDNTIDQGACDESTQYGCDKGRQVREPHSGNREVIRRSREDL